MIGKAPMEGPEGEEIYRFIQGVENGQQTNNNSQSSGSEETSQ